MRAVPSSARPTVLVLLAAVCFGTTGTAQALAPDGATPASVGAIRIVVGGTLLGLVALWSVRRQRNRAWTTPRTDPASLALVAVSVAGVVAYQPFFFAGVRSSGVAVGTLVALGSAPLATGLLQWAVLRRRPSRRWFAATLVAAVGLIGLSVGDSLVGGGALHPLDPLGVLASVGAGASYAVYTIGSKGLLDRGWSPDLTMGTAFGGAAVVMALALPWLPLGWLASASGVAAAAFLGVVSTALAYVLFARGLRALPASNVATLTLAEPLTAGLLGVLLLREPLSAIQVLGAFLVVAGLVILSLPGRRGSRRGEWAAGPADAAESVNRQVPDMPEPVENGHTP
ncbi:MAG TPA: EamA family transporter [Actinomycetales bacterium]|nr:EamA family transporter [Actinomycetales bacterium]